MANNLTHIIPETMQKYYSARAPEYDRVYSKPERQADLRAIERWLPSVFKEQSIIEVACGTGYWSQFLATTGQKLLAIDTSTETLAIANERITDTNVQFLVADAYQLPINQDKFLGAFAGFWLSHVPRERLSAFLHGLHKTLTPGARVVFLDNRYVVGSNTAISEQIISVTRINCAV